MKFNVKAKTLLAQLVVVGKAIAPKSALQILSNFLFELTDGTLTITGSDSDNVITTSIRVEDAEGNGRFCIESKRLTELLKVMPDCSVTFTINETTGEVRIKYEKGKFDLSSLKGEEYPQPEEINPDSVVGTLNMPTSQILNALDKVGFATSNDELRPQMNGVYWDIMEDAITFVATDTRVLAKYRSTQIAPGITCSFVLHSRAIPLVRALIGKSANVDVTITDKALYFKGESFTMRTCKVNGTFPNYNRVIPPNAPFTLDVDHNDLADAVDRVSICADPTHSLIRMKISPIDILVSAQDIGYNIGGSESVGCTYQGEELEIGFSSSYLKGVLKAINTRNITIKLTDATRPGIFLPSENDEFGELTLLCMPMSLQSTTAVGK